MSDQERIIHMLTDRVHRVTGGMKRARTAIKRAILSKTQRIGNVHSVQDDPAFVLLRDRVRASGTDDLAHFGNGYAEQGGLYLQQNPDEFAALCLLLKHLPTIRNYLEIGSASGGSCRFLSEQVGLGRVFSIDDGRHPRAPEQPQNFARVENLKQFIGDSHSQDARQFLASNLVEPLDVAFIDGDHSYEGVWADIRLAMAFSRPGTIFIFHDTVACEGVERAWLEVLQGGLVKGLAEYAGEEKPLGIGVGTLR